MLCCCDGQIVGGFVIGYYMVFVDVGVCLDLFVIGIDDFFQIGVGQDVVGQCVVGVGDVGKDWGYLIIYLYGCLDDCCVYVGVEGVLELIKYVCLCIKVKWCVVVLFVIGIL